MGTLYLRGSIWWVGFTDADGQRVLMSTGERSKPAARLFLKTLEAEVRRGVRQARSTPTLADYADAWLKAREERGFANVRQERQRLRDYVLAELGGRRLDEVTPRMVRGLVDGLRGKLASRSLNNLYGTLHKLFADAVTAELLFTNPCNLARGELPERADVDPAWRDTAVFTRTEAELLLSHPGLPLHHRVAYAFALLAGLRLGEVSALRWGDYDAEARPLGALLVHSSYNRYLKKLKVTKTGRARRVPVHPTLAALLAEWKLSGWAQAFERAPRPGDLVVPGATGKHLLDQTMNEWRAADFKKLGLRDRRFHDMRRTFVSIGRDDGAGELLRWVSHGPSKRVFDSYTTPSWPALCECVSKLRVALRRSEVRELRAAGERYSAALQSTVFGGQTMESTDENTSGRRGTRSLTGRRRYGPPQVVSGTSLRVVGGSGHLRSPPCSSVAAEAIAEQVDNALAGLRRGDSREAVTARLEQLLQFIRGAH